jgi:uncharacterized protein YndB with AHSA1/START domain
MSMNEPRIHCVTYIESNLNAVWDALTNPDLTERYWFGTRIESDWKLGSTALCYREGAVTDEYTVLAVDSPHTLCYTFHPVFAEEYRAEPPSQVTFTLAQAGDVVRLTMVHDHFTPDSRVYPSCSVGWPMILSSLKTLLETGKPLPPFNFSEPSA